MYAERAPGGTRGREGMVKYPGAPRRAFHLGTALMAAVLSLAVPRPGNAQTDTIAPELQDFSFTPTTVNVSGGAQSVTVTLHITDSPAGFSYGMVHFRSPSGGQYHLTPFYPSSHLVGGSVYDGTYQVSVEIPQFSEAGTWRVGYVYLQDSADNKLQLMTADLATLGFPTELVVQGGPDLAAPDLQGFSFTPTMVNVSGGAQSVTVTLHITDSPAGFTYGMVHFRSPSGGQYHLTPFYPSSHLVGGSIYDGTYQVSVEIPQFSEAGTWRVGFVYLQDSADNKLQRMTTDLANLGFPTALFVLSEPADTIAPELQDLSFTPTTVNVSGGAQSVTVTLHITDSPAGFSYGMVHFRSPSGGQYHLTPFYPSSHLVGGSVYDGTYQVSVEIPQFSEAGTWRVGYVYLQDSADNKLQLMTADLATLGFPTELRVTSNEPPVANAGPHRTAIVGETVTFDGSGSYDPDGSIESSLWDFGDGATGEGMTVSHAYAAAGEFTVTLTVADNQGATAVAGTSVTVRTVAESIQSLSKLVLSFNLKQGIAKSLTSILQSAYAAASSGNRKDAAKKMIAFIGAVEAQRGKAISMARSDQLLAEARRILAVLG
jgi:PKD repeat protein